MDTSEKFKKQYRITCKRGGTTEILWADDMKTVRTIMTDYIEAHPRADIYVHTQKFMHFKFDDCEIIENVYSTTALQRLCDAKGLLN